MELQLTGKESGWWIVSHENKLWLPKGELPQGNAANWSLQGTTARQIGEWQGQSVWLIRQMMPSGMGSVRQLLDVDRGLFQLAGRGVQLAEFYRSHRFVAIVGMKCMPAGRNGPAYVTTVGSAIIRKLLLV